MRWRIALVVTASALLAAACGLPEEQNPGTGTGDGGFDIQYCEDDGRGELQEDRCTRDPGRYGNEDYYDPGGGPPRTVYDGTP